MKVSERHLRSYAPDDLLVFRGPKEDYGKGSHWVVGDEYGYAEVILLRDSDAIQPDTFYIDKDGDGETDSVLLDTNYNQKLDATVTFENIRGRDVAIWHIDSDEDGEDDLLGIDYDLDGEIDRTEPL